MCGDKVFPHYCYHTNHTTSNAKFSTIRSYDQGRHQYNPSPRYCNTSWSFLWHQEIYPTRGVMLLAAVIPLLRFFIMNISMCFLENVKINMLFLFLYFHCNTFFLQSMQDPHGGTDILEELNAGVLSMTEEGLPPTFCSILIFKTYAHPASLLQCFFAASLAS